MKLNSGERHRLFNMARELSPELGTLFQNPMEISVEDLQHEINEVNRLKRLEIARWNPYYQTLGELLCFPEKWS